MDIPVDAPAAPPLIEETEETDVNMLPSQRNKCELLLPAIPQHNNIHLPGSSVVCLFT